MRLIQFNDPFYGQNRRAVAAVADDGARRVHGAETVIALAALATAESATLAQAAEMRLGQEVDYDKILAEGRVLPPVDHPDPARTLVSGTGLTHTGSARARDEMHTGAKNKTQAGDETDSMRMFRMGVEGGKPAAGEFFGAQPEWFYKGDGRCIIVPGGELQRPAYAQDGGEEPEIAGLYWIDERGIPRRLGFALGNEFSDHIMEKHNYLWLAHSKLRQCAIGPELLTGDLPRDVQGQSAIRRAGKTVWQKPFTSGEDNMSHSIANLERHHFKYAAHRRPGDVHIHFFGTATLSFADGFAAADGDEFVIECAAFGRPLVNILRVEKDADRAQTEVLPL